MSIIVNPHAEKKAEERSKARQMDVTNLARNLFITSASHGTLIDQERCFALAEQFKQVEERIYPPETL